MSMKSDKLPLRWYHASILWNEYLDLSFKKPQQLDLWLAEQYKKNKKFGKKDRKFYSDILFSALRFAPLAILLSKLTKDKISIEYIDQIINSHLLFMDQYREELKIIQFENIISTLFLVRDDVPYKYHIDNNYIDLFSKVREHFDDSILLRCVLSGFPIFYYSRLEKRAELSIWNSKNKEKFIKNHLSKSPQWVRVYYPEKINEIITEFKSVELSFKFFGELSIQIEGDVNLKTFETYKKGYFGFQDLASQNIGDSFLVSKPSKEKLWDACCGGGGKTIQIASRFKDKLTIYASDIREYKLKDAGERAEKSCLRNIKFFTWDATCSLSESTCFEPNLKFDKILVDVPCSSSGTWRTHPDRALLTQEHDINALVELQKKILQNVSTFLSKDGVLIYATCSFFYEENEAIIEDFLNKNNDFKCLKMEVVGNPNEDSDTLFYAQLKRC